MTGAIAEPNLTDLVEETSAAAVRSLELAKAAAQEVLDLEGQHASLLSRISAATALVVSGGEIDENLSELGESAGQVAKQLAEKRIELAECERKTERATLAANKAQFTAVAADAREQRIRFHTSYRETCLTYGALIESIAKLASLANNCRNPMFGALPEHKDVMTDLQSEDSLCPLTRLLENYKVTTEMNMGDVARYTSLYCPPLVLKIIPRERKK